MAREADIQILDKNFHRFSADAEDLFRKGSYTSSAVLFYKAIGAAADILLLKTEGKAPSSHAERFRMLTPAYPEVSTILDKDYPLYQDSYTKELSKEAAEVLKEDAQRLKKMLEE